MHQSVVLENKSQTGRHLLFRYPSIEDAGLMCDYINTLSKERTYIRFQGEQLSLEDEKEYLNFQLRKISQGEAVLLLVFADKQLIGIAGVEMQDKASIIYYQK